MVDGGSVGSTLLENPFVVSSDVGNCEILGVTFISNVSVLFYMRNSILC